MDSEIIITIINGIVAVLNIVISSTVAKVGKRQNVISNLCDGVVSLLRTEIITAHNKYDKMGYAPIYAKENVTRLYKAYSALGGNNVGTELYNQIMAMPESRKDEEQ